MRKKCFTSAVVGLASLALCCVAAGPAMATVPTLTHLWNFDGNLNDGVGTKTADALGTGTAFGTPTGGGISGQAAQFDGINDLLYIPATSTGSGTEEDPYGITDSPLPAGAFTISFWEYCVEPGNQGYLVSDAAVNPDYQWENLMIRRRTCYRTGETESIKPFAEIGDKLVGTPPRPYYAGWMHTNGYWRADQPQYEVTNYGDSRQFPTLPTGEWVHHVITNYAPADNDAGWAIWYVDGQIAARNPVGIDPFTGLQPKQELDPYPEPAFDWQNRRAGMVIGNLIDNDHIDDYNENYADNARIGPTGNYHGYIDSFQVYTGTVTPDQVRYLNDNPGADLRTYTAPSASAQPKGAQVYRWTFDGNLDGQLVTATGSTSSYGGVAVGNAAAGTDNGVSGGAVSFDGVDDAVHISKDVLPAGSFSVAFWAKEQQLVTGKEEYAYLVDGTDPGRFRLLNEYKGPVTDLDPDPRNARVLDALVTQNYSLVLGEDGQADRDSWDFNVWRQHVITVNADGDLRWYVNSQLMSETPTFPWDGLIGDLWLGNNSALNEDFKGLIDDLQIYNWDINATDVTWLWNNAGLALTVTGGTPVYQPYDVNEDGFVGADDLDVVRAHWGESAPGGKDIGDINLDGFVGADDLDQLRAHWGEVCPPVPGLVPEPSTFVLLLMGALAIIAVRRVR